MIYRALALSSLVMATAAWTGAARAAMVAGWDFSQYAGDSFLTIDGATFVDTLDANYSNFDATGNAGVESAAFGTMYYDGSNGSSSFPVGTGTEPFIPTTGSLTSNSDAPVQTFGDNPFDSFTVLASEGQQFTQDLAMTASAPVSIVFSATVAPVQVVGTDWMIRFAGKTFTGNSNVSIEVSTDGASYTAVTTTLLDTNDSPFAVVLGPDIVSDEIFVRMNFLDAASSQPIIDNVAIFAGPPVPIFPYGSGE